MVQWERLFYKAAPAFVLNKEVTGPRGGGRETTEEGTDVTGF